MQKKKVVRIKEMQRQADGREVEVEVDHDIRDLEDTFDGKPQYNNVNRYYKEV